MSKNSDSHRDRYDTSGNPEAEYADEEKTVLKNLMGITDLNELQIEEERGLATAYEHLLGEIRTDTMMTCELLRHIHSRIFGELYEWAGRWRTVNISKPGITWPPPRFIDQNMQEFERSVLNTFPAEKFGDDISFCEAIAQIQGEFLVVHPFREGNARTIKLMTNLLAAQTGRPLLQYDSSDAGRDRYIAAAQAAFCRDYRPMAIIIKQALIDSQI